jgi:alpha-tubulin suppressor-like RCC1 family protein
MPSRIGVAQLVRRQLVRRGLRRPDNMYGDLGDSSDMNEPEPNAVLVSLPGTPVGVSAGGEYSTCVVVSNATGDTVWCWGYGNGGALGNGSSSNSVGIPVMVQLSTCL